jgi:hypothetical protein
VEVVTVQLTHRLHAVEADQVAAGVTDDDMTVDKRCRADPLFRQASSCDQTRQPHRLPSELLSTTQHTSEVRLRIFFGQNVQHLRSVHAPVALSER